MSTFLRRLLERSLASTATVQPRLASRFEFVPNPARLSELTIETVAAAPAASAPLPSVTDFAAPSAAPHPEIAKSAAPVPPLAGPLPAAHPPAFPASPPPVAAIPPPPASQPITPPPAAPPLTESSVRSAREKFSLPPPSPSTLLIERVTERIREIHPVSGNGSSVSTAAAVSSGPAVAVASAPPPAPRERIVPPLSPSTSPSPTSFGPPSAGPVVRVTIGRVDIRAIAPAAPPAVRATPPPQRPLIPLETYLKQRDAK